jgi:putative oxidoreductase
MIARLLHWICRCFLAGLFLYSGAVKVQGTLQFAATISSYQLLPFSLVLPLAKYLPWFEIVLGILLLTGWKMRYASLITVGLLAVFIAALTLTWLRGIDADCGCFAGRERISPYTIARDSLFLLPAIFLAGQSFKKWGAGQDARIPVAE